MEEKAQRQECLGPTNQALSLQMPLLQDPGLKTIYGSAPLQPQRTHFKLGCLCRLRQVTPSGPQLLLCKMEFISSVDSSGPRGCPDALNVHAQHLIYVPEAEWGLWNDAPRLMSLSPQPRVWSVQTPQGPRERPAGRGPRRSNTSSGAPGMPQHLRSSLGGYADKFFHQPG